MSRFQGTSLIKAALKCLVVPTVGGPDDFTLPLSLPSLPLRAPACSWAAAASPLPSLLCSGHLSRSMGSEAHLWRVLREKGLGGGSVGGHPALTPHPALLTCTVAAIAGTKPPSSCSPSFQSLLGGVSSTLGHGPAPGTHRHIFPRGCLFESPIILSFPFAAYME